MSFPSKWFEFSNHKELRRLRKDVNDTLELKIQTAMSIILAIIAFVFDRYIACCDLWLQILICVIFCVIVALIFIVPYIIKYSRLRKRCNVIINGKDAINIFDDEILYSVLVACEYSNMKATITCESLKSEYEKFYDIEIKYYITESIKKMVKFSASSCTIFGDKENQIPFERIYNVVDMINFVIRSSNLSIEKNLLDDFRVFCQTIGLNNKNN